MKLLNVFCFYAIIFFANFCTAKSFYSNNDFSIKLTNYGNYSIIHFDLSQNAKIYWRSPGELGLKTNFSFNNSSNIKDIKVFWPVPELYTENSVSSYVYQNMVDFVIKTKAKNIHQAVDLKVDIDFMLCKQTCQNYTIPLSNKINPQNFELAIAEQVLEALKKMPKENGSEGLRIISVTQDTIDNKEFLKISFEAREKQLNPKVLLDFNNSNLFDPLNISLSNEGELQVIRVPFIKDPNDNLKEIYLNLTADNGNSVEYSQYLETTSNYPFYVIIFFAFVGGVILNFMPCILPIIGLKLLQIVKLSGKEKNIAKLYLLSQSAGIVASFMLIAPIVYILQQLGLEVGLGMHMQQPFYLIFVILILSIISIILLSNKEIIIEFPFLNSFLLKIANNSFLGSLANGFLITLLSLSCSAPFVSIAIAYSLSTYFPKMILIFSAMGLGMSLPYLLMAFRPGLLSFIPKPGAWLNKFKKFLALIIFASTIWFILIIAEQLGNKSAICLFLLILLIKFTILDNKIAHKLKLLLLSILALLSFIVPYQLYQEKNLDDILIEKTWTEYKPEQVNELIKDNKIIFVDVTASWCATCKINKFTTLDNKVILDYFSKSKVIAMRADITKDNNPQVSMLMKMHNRFGIPINIIYSKKYPGGILLPTILTPNLVIKNIKLANEN